MIGDVAQGWPRASPAATTYTVQSDVIAIEAELLSTGRAALLHVLQRAIYERGMR